MRATACFHRHHTRPRRRPAQYPGRVRSTLRITIRPSFRIHGTHRHHLLCQIDTDSSNSSPWTSPLTDCCRHFNLGTSNAEPSRGSPFHSLNRTPAGGLAPRVGRRLACFVRHHESAAAKPYAQCTAWTSAIAALPARCNEPFGNAVTPVVVSTRRIRSDDTDRASPPGGGAPLCHNSYTPVSARA
jgi:hypothetical protein